MGICSSKQLELPYKIGKSSKSKYVIVFVHGLGGGRETWRIFVNLLAERWTKHKSFDLNYFHFYENNRLVKIFKNCSIIKSFLRVLFGVDIRRVAKGLNSYLEANCYKYEGIILVGHSMGGLVSRRVIVDQLKRSHDTMISKLVTYASPHRGSKWASCFGITLQIRQMRVYTSKFLNTLNSEWNDLSAQQHVNPTYIIADKDRYVTHHSAGGIDENPHEVWDSGQNHFSIIKPEYPDQTGFAEFVKILDEFDTDELYDDSNFEDDFDELE